MESFRGNRLQRCGIFIRELHQKSGESFHGNSSNDCDRNFQAGSLKLLKNPKGDGHFYLEILGDRDRKSDSRQ